jgi:ribonuclease D
MKIHPLITTTEALAAICARLAKSEFVSVDTEFMRENTYWPELCLVQIANEEEAAAVDPLAPGIDLSPCSTCWSTTRTCSRSSTRAGRTWRSSTT